MSSNQCSCNYNDCTCEKICLQQSNKTALILQIILPTVIGIFLVIGSRFFFNYMRKAFGLKYDKAIRLIVQSGLLIAQFGVISWGVYQYKNPCGTVSIWFNGEEGVTIGTVIVGMFSNIIFGFIDNGGLFFGGCYLDELFSKLPGNDDANVVAGYGNTYSDFLGAFLGTFCGLIISHATGIDGGPIWAQALGIVIGCLLGILVPKLLLRSSASMGLNKISARQVLLGAMEEIELDAILKGKTLLQYRAQQAFNKIDSNGDGHLTREEVRIYMKEAMGHDYDQEKLENELKSVWDQVNFDGNSQQYSLQEFEQIYLDMTKLQLEEIKNNQLEKQANYSKNSSAAVQPQLELEEIQDQNIQLK